MAISNLADRVNHLDQARGVDPDFTSHIPSDAPMIPPATPTAGPHRITFIVPNPDATTVSFGAPCNTRINDVGITGRTKTHVHFHVNDHTKTVVTLGGPATTATGMSAYDATVPTSSNGYGMVTDGIAWHDSQLKHYIVSRGDDVILRAVGKSALLKSDDNNVAVEAGEYVSVGAAASVKIIGDTGLVPAKLDNPNYTTPLKAKLSETFDVKSEKMASTVLDCIQSTYGLLTGVIKLNGKDPVWKKFEWKPKTCLDVAKVLVDGGKLVSSIVRTVHSQNAKGKVDILAENYASMSGGVAASIYGRWSASVTSAVSASMIGGTAGVKALLWGSVWSGLGTSIKAGKDLSCEGEWGNASFKGRKEVEIASSTAGVKVGAELDAQLSSKSKTAAVIGKKAFYGGGGKFGIKATDDDMTIGAVGATSNFDSPGFDEKCRFKMTSSDITCYSGQAGYAIRDDKVTLHSNGKAGELLINGSQIQVDGSRICLG